METPSTFKPHGHNTLTISEVLSLNRRINLYGMRINDLSPRGDLGLGLDPEGPVGFARIRGYGRNGVFTVLGQPLVLSVFGEGRPCDPTDTNALPGEHMWRAALADRVLRLELQQGGLAALLEGDAR
jgi:hypothetical protein